MLNQLLKFTLVTTVWFWLKPRWRGLLALSLFVVLVNVLHNEYLDYVQISGDQMFLVWSYVVKWALLTLSFLAYFLFGAVGVKIKAPAETKTAPKSLDVTTNNRNKNDGFDFLRNKKHLQSRADKIIERADRNDRNNNR